MPAEARHPEPVPEPPRAVRAVLQPPRISSDVAFDAVYDDRIRDLSVQHWTPVHIAARAAQLLTRAGATRVVDVGSGVGKFCIVGALSTDAEFVGVEQRRDLVEIARGAALMLGADRARFVHASVDSFSLEGFNGVYLYNPFYEHISPFLAPIDRAVKRSAIQYRHFVRSTTDKHAAMAPPVAVVMYNGFGGVMPSAYDFLGSEPAGGDQLELWVRR